MQNASNHSKVPAEELDRAIDLLTQAGYRVSRPLEERTSFSSDSPPEKLMTVAVLDTETTGTQRGQDRLIELGMVLVEICPVTGTAYRVLEVFDALEDPGVPIPPESTRIHNITDEMVRGKRIDDAEVGTLNRPGCRGGHLV